MQVLLFSGVMLFIAACWTLVIGSQLGISAFDIERYAVWRMTWALAYTVAALSLCAVGWLILFSLVKPGYKPGLDAVSKGGRLGDTGKPADSGGGSARIWYDGVGCRRQRPGRRR